VIVVAAGVYVACGSGAPPKKPDAKTYQDAPPRNPDAPVATGLGKDCSGSGSGDSSLCPGTDPICTMVFQSVGFFCTESCGYGSCAPGGTFGSDNCYCNGAGCPNQGSAGAYAQPPAGGDAICAMQKSMTTATHACLLVSDGPNAGSAMAWSCGLYCGSAGGSDYGNCPSNMTCVANLCQ
jgi:hypothetical protein